MPALETLERGARILRAAGLGRLVDGIGLHVGAAVARLRTVEVDGLRLRGNHAGHLYYLREIAAGRESFLGRLVERAVVPGALAVDGGAHVGYVALLMARAGARVLAFEPNPNLHGVIGANARRNGLGDRVTVVPRALGAAPGRGSLALSGGGDTSTLAHGTGVPVDVVPLDGELGGELPALVKLDLEGWEVQALRGMPGVLASDAVLVVECNPGALAAAGSSAEELVRVLVESGFEVCEVDETGRRLVPGVRIPDIVGYVNVVAARPPRLAPLLRHAS